VPWPHFTWRQLCCSEVTHGFLWNNDSIGQGCADGGRLWCTENPNWGGFAGLVAQGIKAARAACPASKIAIHTDLGNHICNPAAGGCAKGIASAIQWYSSLQSALRMADATGPHFDMIGLSMYPKWSAGTVLQSIAQLPLLARRFPAQTIYIAETSYPGCCSGDPPLQPGYPTTEVGQTAFVVDVRAAMGRALGAQNGGVLWWEGSEHSWGSLFGSGYKPDQRAKCHHLHATRRVATGIMS
jgi:arabinogalactan endo-1,4-beta-galactosidase